MNVRTLSMTPANARADALERQAASAPTEAQEKALNDRADAVENAADEKSDAMHRQVDKDY